MPNPLDMCRYRALADSGVIAQIEWSVWDWCIDSDDSMLGTSRGRFKGTEADSADGPGDGRGTGRRAPGVADRQGPRGFPASPSRIAGSTR